MPKPSIRWAWILGKKRLQDFFGYSLSHIRSIF